VKTLHLIHKPMKFLSAAAIAYVFAGSASAEYFTICIVRDPTGTPLNARSAPNGGAIVATLDNGSFVLVRDRVTDNRGTVWSFVSNISPSHKDLDNAPLGWVFSPYLACKSY
jgi:hypothetical protein